MRHTGRDDKDIARAREDVLATHGEAHPAADDLEALLLERVHVQAAGHTPAWYQFEVDREQLAAALSCGRAECDPLAADRVHDRLSRGCHDCSSRWVLERVRGQFPHGIGGQETLGVRPLRYPEPWPTAMALVRLRRD
jgi:hypothetical protein